MDMKINIGYKEILKNIMKTLPSNSQSRRDDIIVEIN